jgi:hypothetical protein
LTPLVLALLLIVAGGSALRLLPAIVGDFPLNDGGLFLAMMERIQAGGASLPAYVSFNHNAIPFAYPPLGLFLGAFLSSITGAEPIDVLRVVPAMVSIITVPAAFLLFKQLLDTELRAIVATAAFAVIPRSYNWMIAGGGITRGIGLLAALLTLTAAVQLYRDGRLRFAVVTGVLLGLTGLAHPQAGVFAGLSIIVLLPFTAADRKRAIKGLLVTIALASGVVAPWLAVVLSRYGPTTLLGAAETGGTLRDSLMTFVSMRFSDGFIGLMGFIGAFGLFVCLMNRRWLFPLWLVVIFVAGSRGALTYGSVVISGAVAYALADALRLLHISEWNAICDFRIGRQLGLIGAVFALGIADAVASPASLGSPLHVLPLGERNAMAWIAGNTPASAQFMVVSATDWPTDSTSEWFPVLAHRASVATVQGTEWLGPGIFDTYQRRYRWLQSCAVVTDLPCAQLWAEQVGRVDYVMAVTSRDASTEGYDCCLAFADRLIANGGKQVYSNEDVRIVRVDLGGGG